MHGLARMVATAPPPSLVWREGLADDGEAPSQRKFGAMFVVTRSSFAKATEDRDA